MAPPSLWHKFRQILGRGLRETGQALDRLGVKTVALATTEHVYYDDPVIYEDHLSRHRQLFPLLAAGRPLLHANVAFVAPCATLVGSVRLGANASVWYGAVLRGDGCENVESHFVVATENTTTDTDSTGSSKWPLDPDRWRDQDDGHGGGIFIGDDTNLQDGCVVTARVEHTTVGRGVTVGHLAQIHSATIGDYCLIGMGSVIEEGVVIEEETLIAAGAVVPAKTHVKAGELWVGNPARKLRDLSPAERERLHYQSSEYIKVAKSQRSVMELGGNVDPATGASVFIVDDMSQEQRLAPSTTTAHTTLASTEDPQEESAPVAATTAATTSMPAASEDTRTSPPSTAAASESSSSNKRSSSSSSSSR